MRNWPLPVRLFRIFRRIGCIDNVEFARKLCCRLREILDLFWEKCVAKRPIYRGSHRNGDAEFLRDIDISLVQVYLSNEHKIVVEAGMIKMHNATSDRPGAAEESGAVSVVRCPPDCYLLGLTV